MATERSRWGDEIGSALPALHALHALQALQEARDLNSKEEELWEGWPALGLMHDFPSYLATRFSRGSLSESSANPQVMAACP